MKANFWGKQFHFERGKFKLAFPMWYMQPFTFIPYGRAQREASKTDHPKVHRNKWKSTLFPLG